MPGALYEPGELVNAEAEIAAGRWRRHQMPAYHLMADDRTGITLVNIGVGPSNAKTICDHIAVLRPEVWLMIGHCGGLRPSQSIGDYVLAHAYLRDDHLLDKVLPPEIPVPAIAEVQKALFEAAMMVTGEEEDDLKRRLRTGTVVTTDNRNWELRYTASARRFNLSRAVAIDMESATVAAQGYRFRVPYGTLLCVSDKPLHGELKLPGQANAFYERAISLVRKDDRHRVRDVASDPFERLLDVHSRLGGRDGSRSTSGRAAPTRSSSSTAWSCRRMPPCTSTTQGSASSSTGHPARSEGLADPRLVVHDQTLDSRSCSPSPRRCRAPSCRSTCAEGDTVRAGQQLVVLESMKMEHVVAAERPAS